MTPTHLLQASGTSEGREDQSPSQRRKGDVYMGPQQLSDDNFYRCTEVLVGRVGLILLADNISSIVLWLCPDKV